MKLKHLFVTSACVVSFVSASLAQDKPTASTVLATVNGTEITLGHVIAMTARLPEQYQDISDADLYKGVLDQLINQTAISSGVDANSTEMRLMIENETRALLASEALDNISDGATSDADIQAAFDEKYGGLPLKKEYRASHILVGSEDEAKALVVSLTGGADFSELAKEKSTGPSGPNGGDLGWFVTERMVPEFGGAVKNMAAGDVSEPIKTQFGWHVIKLFDSRDKPAVTLEEVRVQITEDLTAAALKIAIAKFEADAEILRNDVTVDPSSIRLMELLD